jgi:hypothetical protein
MLRAISAFGGQSEASMFRSLGRMPWSFLWLLVAATADGEAPLRVELTAIQDAEPRTPQRAMARIRSLGAKIEFCERVQPLVVEVQPVGIVGLPIDALPPSVPLPDPPPEVPAEELLPKSEEPPTIGGIGLIADAFVSPLIAPHGVSTQKAVSIIIDHHWRGGDSAVALFREVPDLVSLKLRNARLTDAAIRAITECRELESLEITGNTFTAEALTRFRAQRPDVRLSIR